MATNTITIDAQAFKAAQAFVIKDKARAVLTGVCVTYCDEGEWLIEATDSEKMFRAASSKELLLQKVSEPRKNQIVIDGSDIARDIRAKDKALTLKWDTEADLTMVSCTIDDRISHTVKALDGTFPNCSTFTPEYLRPFVAALNPSHLETAAKTARMLNDKNGEFKGAVRLYEDAGCKSFSPVYLELCPENYFAYALIMPIRADRPSELFKAAPESTSDAQTDAPAPEPTTQTHESTNDEPAPEPETDDDAAISRALEYATENGLECKETCICLWITAARESSYANDLASMGLRWSQKRSQWYYRRAA